MACAFNFYVILSLQEGERTINTYVKEQREDILSIH